jgi:hypothetical protein
MAAAGQDGTRAATLVGSARLRRAVHLRLRHPAASVEPLWS